jgi:hypothetical protein
MANFGGAAQGFLDYNQNQQQQQYRQALIAEMLQNMALSKQKQDAALQQQQLQATGAHLAGNAMPQLSAPPAPAQNPNQPPAMPPGQASVPMQQPRQMAGQSPGQMPPPPQGGPQMSMAPGMQPQPMPWKPMPKEPPGGGTPQPGGMQQLGPPPTPAESVRQVDGAIEGGTVIPSKKLPDPATLMQQWQKEGHTGAEIMAGLDAYMGVYSKVQQQEVEGLKLQLKFKEDQEKFKENWIRDNMRQQQISDSAAARKESVEARRDIAEQASKDRALSREQSSQDRAAQRDLTRELAGDRLGAAKEARDLKAQTSDKQAAVRQSIVKAAVDNSLKRLDEIEQRFGDTTTTSSFFGQSGGNPLTRGVYGLGKGLQGKAQQEADAKWGSFIDEAIPVFTGGLRGSDAFRKFLIEQAPGPGDKPETVREKRRLFRENIKGTSNAFFQKFSSDASMQAPGTSTEEIDAVRAGEGAGAWKVEKVGK